MQIQVRMLLRMAVKRGSIEAHTETAAEMVNVKDGNTEAGNTENSNTEETDNQWTGR